jgi:CubicO group peptidase (beta-lactamase class C family)
VTEHTHFAVGSTTKAFAAAGVSFLVDNNEEYPHIQWDTPVHSIIPDDFVLQDDWYTTHVTIEDALSHRSGLPRHDFTWAFNTASLRDAVRNLRHLPLTEPIRTKFQYCNLMFITMGHLIESVTGKTLGDFLRAHIWAPLGMDETFISFAEARAARPHVDISRGYYTDRAGNTADVGDYDWSQSGGAGNIISSATDYAKWLRTMIDRASPISPRSHTELTRAHSIAGSFVPSFGPDSAPITYGFGWFIHSYYGELLIEHGGAQPGYGTGVFYFPRRKFGLALFSNNMMAGGLVNQILAYGLMDDLFQIPDKERLDLVPLGDQLLRMINSTFTRETLQRLYPTIPDPPLPLPANLSAFLGVYTHPAYPLLNITDGDDHCAGDLLPPWSNDTKPVKLCITSLFDNGRDNYTPVEIMHVSGDFWALAAEFSTLPALTKVEFRLGPDGHAQSFGVLLEPAMKGELLWWDRNKDS